MKMVRWLAFIVPLAILVLTYLYEPQSFFLVLMIIAFLASASDNVRLRKKLAELGHPDDLKSRIEARKAAQE